MHERRTAKRCPLILTNLDGKAWAADGFRSSWRKACAAAGVVGMTCAARLALVVRTEAEIATLTGHEFGDVRSSMPTICTAIRRWPRARSGSSKRERNL
jgi:hypothetical protein